MSGRGERAEAYFRDGYNCAQAVVLAYADRMGLDKCQAAKMVSPFGGGMGRLREVCGAVSGMFLVYGAVHGYAELADPDAKRDVYRAVQEMAGRFRKLNGSIVCGKLLGLPGAQKPEPEERTESFYRKRPCAQLVRIAAEIVEEFI